MTSDIGEIAAAMRAAGADRTKSRELLASLYADTVELQHDPPGTGDGSVPARMLIALAEQEVAAMERALPDSAAHPLEVSVDGDRLRMRGRVEGTLADGTRVDVMTNTVFTVAGGRIVGLRSEMTPEDMQTYGAVLAAGAFEVPPDLVRE
jgi:hypothetical protein